MAITLLNVYNTIESVINKSAAYYQELKVQFIRHIKLLFKATPLKIK